MRLGGTESPSTALMYVYGYIHALEDFTGDSSIFSETPNFVLSSLFALHITVQSYRSSVIVLGVS